MATSSTKKAAKLANKGGGRTVRFQGGTVFPIAVAAVLVIGLALIIYGRQTLPAADDSPPTVNDHWHAAYGFYLCDTWYQLDGDLEERDSRGQFTNTNFLRTGIHSHNDGVIHWHPYNSTAVGNNAIIEVFLETYEVELTNDRLEFPPQNALGGQQVWDEEEHQCDGEDAELSMVVWDSFTDTDDGTRYVANMDQVRVDQDGMVFAFFFVADGEPQVMPPWAAQLPQLGAIDTGQVLPDDLLQGTSSVVVDDANTDETTSDEATTDDTDG